MTIRRPVMRYHGGKFRLAPKIIALFPPHRIYVEPYGGAGSVLMRKERAPVEVLNDLDNETVNVFRVLRDPASAARLRELLRLTPFSRTEFRCAYEPSDDPIEQARRTLAKCFMAHGSTARRQNRTGFRGKTWGSRKHGAAEWSTFPNHIESFVERLRGVTIECRPALEILDQHESAETLFYCDPPYVEHTRTSTVNKGRDCAYAHDMRDDNHRALAAALRSSQAMVVLSGYPCPLYDEELYPDWHRVEFKVLADGAQPRTEVVYLNRAAMAARRPLFAKAAE